MSDTTHSPPHSLQTGESFAFGLTRSEVDRLRRILCTETGHEVSSEEAWQRAIALVALFRMLLGPLPDDPEA